MLARTREFLKEDVEIIIFIFKFIFVFIYLKETFDSGLNQVEILEKLGIFYPLYPMILAISLTILAAICVVAAHIILRMSGIGDKPEQ
ncbi:TPA: hypothetical protein DCZ46_00890 [Candidatus Campbellbacteria bacterium]|nr:MAG: hypothetical protein UR74_C0001G0214 [Candidatus Campbellbacteria bacterium GW2011_GWD2_35_24]KKP76081.1 MAG: hypothetical protein UR75_C0001G0115 [Candidatus Campbellbacteria bacterium GW2011_GWC2_35_28]KKP77270.1 MAG: hypothetical protein UR76_C0001G0115 [Candidatus Campbellbacteria bacterium GW2011_GWC1_35_31]KKP79199.1 MAG: hypothetical protein UR79_C0001G0115 [Candidatus Campbellbacteria bacterium GW2011_GWD1_35_49]HAP73812.1 hypothetical protein [Candidatus Campbellbacteria bacter